MHTHTHTHTPYYWRKKWISCKLLVFIYLFSNHISAKTCHGPEAAPLSPPPRLRLNRALPIRPSALTSQGSRLAERQHLESGMALPRVSAHLPVLLYTHPAAHADRSETRGGSTYSHGDLGTETLSPPPWNDVLFLSVRSVAASPVRGQTGTR